MKNNAGFTLMELMVTIAIIGIMSAIAVPNMITWRNSMQFNSAVRQVKISIEQTRMDAIKANMPSRIDFIDGSNTFNTVRWDPTANAFAAPNTHQLPPGVILANSNFANDQLRFSSRGMPANVIGGTLRLQNTSGSLCRLIVIANVGTSRIADCP